MTNYDLELFKRLVDAEFERLFAEETRICGEIAALEVQRDQMVRALEDQLRLKQLLMEQTEKFFYPAKKEEELR